MGKRVDCPPLWYTLVLWVWGVSYLLIMTPSVDIWSFIFYLVLALLLCVSLVWWLLFYGFISVRPLDHWYPILSQLNFMVFIFVRPLYHWYPILSQLNFMVFIFGPLVKLTLWFLFFKTIGPLVPYSKSTYFYFYVWLVNTLKPRGYLSNLSRRLVKIINSSLEFSFDICLDKRRFSRDCSRVCCCYIWLDV